VATMTEPRQVKKTCRGCGAPSFGFVVELKQFGVRNGSHGGKRATREAVLGGELCDHCCEVAQAEEMAQEVETRRAANLGAAGLPRLYRGWGFEGTTQKEAVRLAEQWSRGKLQGLYLTGKVGVGKTGLAAAALAAMTWRRRVQWVDTAALVSSLRASFTDQSRAEAMRVITGSGAAVFDDLDRVTPSDYVREILFTAINTRIAAGSPLLVTTNLPIGELGDRLGTPILSRLDGYCEVVEMVGPDRRVEKAA
jgi:DNA replication protein DnaC